MKINFSLRIFRYILIALSIFIFTSAIQIFVQNFNIENEINELKTKQSTLSQDSLWRKNFYEPYLNSEYSKLLFAHQAWVVWKNEKIIKIVVENNKKKQEKEQVIKNSVKWKKSCLKFFKILYYKYF